MLDWCLDELKKEGIETETFQLGGEPVAGCKACMACFKTEELKCAQKDIINTIIPKVVQADALILGSPVYFADLTPELKAFIDRVGYVCISHAYPLRRKPGAAVVVARRAGMIHAYDSINHFFGIMQMLTVGSRYWNLGVAREAGAVKEDQEAEDTMRILGANMAWLLKKISS
jgi:multimeric flavodoxin WrbA